jgi:hypothetical protein
MPSQPFPVVDHTELHRINEATDPFDVCLSDADLAILEAHLASIPAGETLSDLEAECYALLEIESMYRDYERELVP